MPVHRHHVAPYSACKPCAADRQRARRKSDAAICHPRLNCTQGATGVQSSQKVIDSSARGMDGCTFLFFQATPNAPQRQGRLVVLPPGIRPPDSHAHGTGSPRYGGSVSATRITATSTSQVSGSVPRHAARARRCSPALMQGPRGSPCLAHLGPITIPVQDPK
jgi:hypothetical protein